MKLINLDENVIQALDFLDKNKPPTVNLNQFRLPFVVGSGNAIHSGRIMFSGRAAIFSDESDFKQNLKAYVHIVKKRLIKDCVIISASGEKDSIWEVEWGNKYGLKTTLLTCNKDSSAGKIADKVFVYGKIPEPYTYNVSTYMGMILSTTQEKPDLIKKFITKLKLPQNFSSYVAYTFLLPDKYVNICPMIYKKQGELFGSHLCLRAFSHGRARHGEFVNPWAGELVISLAKGNKYFGHPQHRWDLELPNFTSFVTIYALTFYIIGKIQEIKPQYFKRNLKAFCEDYGPKAYGKDKPFDIIVPAN